jgi:hypothetical protein
MAFINVRATVECDGCARHMIVEVDAAEDRPQTFTWSDLVEEAVRGGIALVSIRGVANASGMTSVQDGKCLCPDCTSRADEEADDEDDLDEGDDE